MLENREQYEWALSRVEVLVNDVGYKPVKSYFFVKPQKAFGPDVPCSAFCERSSESASRKAEALRVDMPCRSLGGRYS